MKSRLLVISLAMLGSLSAAFAQNYVWDDGSSENSVGLTAGGNLAWMNHFNVTGGNNVITNMHAAWGTPTFPNSSGVSNGTPFRWFIWGDPGGTNAPNGAGVTLLSQGVSAVAGGSIDTDVLQAWSTGAVLVPNSFFIGVAVDQAAATFPAALDQTLPNNGQSWVAGSGTAGGFDPNNVGGGIGVFNIDTIGLAGDWLLRATGRPVPEPATVLALGLGAAALLRRRRKA